jgi:MYXO-CTERM domain-containing protein
MNASKGWAVAVAIALGAAAAGGAATRGATINELRFAQPGANNQEYFELAGSAGESLNGLSLIVIGDGAGLSGVIESITNLSSQVIPADDHFLVAETTFATAPPAGWPGGSVDLGAGASGLNFENGDTVTVMLVSGLSAAIDTDLDTNDDGTLDSTPWTAVIDSVALVADPTFALSERYYSTTTVGPETGTTPPMHVFRSPDATGGWMIGDADGAPAFLDTPGTANVPEPAGVAVAGLVGARLLRRRRAKPPGV